MMHPDHLHLIMGLLRYSTLGLGLVFVLRLINYVFNYLWWFVP